MGPTLLELKGVKSFIDENSLIKGLASLGIRWIFNTIANPSEGGFWERLVQSVKKALSRMLREHAPRQETLQCFLIQAESMITSRSLTLLPVTLEEPDPLTPNHFLLGCPNSTQTPAPFEPTTVASCQEFKKWNVASVVARLFTGVNS